MNKNRGLASLDISDRQPNQIFCCLLSKNFEKMASNNHSQQSSKGLVSPLMRLFSDMLECFLVKFLIWTLVDWLDIFDEMFHSRALAFLSRRIGKKASYSSQQSVTNEFTWRKHKGCFFRHAKISLVGCCLRFIFLYVDKDFVPISSGFLLKLSNRQGVKKFMGKNKVAFIYSNQNKRIQNEYTFCRIFQQLTLDDIIYSIQPLNLNGMFGWLGLRQAWFKSEFKRIATPNRCEMAKSLLLSLSKSGRKLY